MKWFIPAKTFFLGEYAALAGAPALILTTEPCFEISLIDEPGLHGIHRESPAGKWWLRHGHVDRGLHWSDPYQGRGGMGASSAQFLGAFFASLCSQNIAFNDAHTQAAQQKLLDAYLQVAWDKQGIQPSGYDVLAQALSGCVYIHRQVNDCQIYSWPFQDIDFLLLHTGQKLATHHHLQTLATPNNLHQLTTIVNQARGAFELVDSQALVESVNAYHQQLKNMGLVAKHSLEHIDCFKAHPDVLAVKGCGAMGADVLLLLVAKNSQAVIYQELVELGWDILATNAKIHA